MWWAADYLLGHFVGGAGTSPGNFHHQYIQDLDSCLASGLADHISL
ncbi:hypothetical protein ACIRRH_39350 [Kitasatospora sp. NPDC101235]